MLTSPSSWTGKPQGFTDAEGTTYHGMGGTEATRQAILARSNRVMAVEKSPSGIYRFMILTGIHQHHSGVILASYGNSLMECRPVQVEASITKGIYSVLWKSRAEHQNFLRSPTEQVDWAHPDDTQFSPEESGITAARASDDDTATVVMIPKAYLLTADISGKFHGREVMAPITPLERLSYPDVADYIDSIHWLLANNDGVPLGPNSTFLKWTGIDATPFLQVLVGHSEQVDTPVKGLNTTDDVFIDYTIHYRMVTDKVAYDQNLQSYPPPAGGSPAPAVASLATTNDPVATALIDALGRGKLTQAEQEALEERTDAGWVIRLLFAELYDNETNPYPGTTTTMQKTLIRLPPLTDSFENQVLKPSKNVYATKRMSLLWTTSSSNSSKRSLASLDGLHEAHATLITEFFVAQLRSAEFSTLPLTLNPSQVRTTISLLLFAPPALTADEYAETVELGRLVHQQIGQGEDARNQAKKATAHDPKINVHNRFDFITTVTAIAAFERILVDHTSNYPGTEPANSVLIEGLNLALQNLVLDEQAKQWFRKYESCTPAIWHLFLEFQSIFRELAQFACAPDSIRAAKAHDSGYITDQVTIQRLRDIHSVIGNIVAVASGVMSSTMPANWLVNPSVGQYFGNTLKHKSTDTTQTPAANTDRSAPAKRNRTNNNNTPIDPPINGNNTMSKRSPSSPAVFSSKESKGMLTYTGTGPPPSITMTVKEKGQDTARYICRDYIIKGRSCRWGSQCRFVHLNNLQQLDTESNDRLKQFIQSHKQYSFTTTAAQDAVPAATIVAAQG
jgi:hypothetical protein